MPTVVSADRFRDMVDEARRGDRAFAVVDTRPTDSYEGWRIADSINYFYKPFHEFDLEAFEAETGLSPQDRIVTTCAKGKASLALAEELEASGYDDVVVVEDGMRGWSAVYDHVSAPLPDAGDEPLEVVQIQRRAKGCLGYLIVGGSDAGSTGRNDAERVDGGGAGPMDGGGSDADRVAVAVDVSRHGEEWLEAAADRDARIAAVLDTHVHADHLSGGRELASDLGVPYHLPAAAADRDVAYEFEPLARNETLDVGGIDVKVLATPGHTDDMASYLVGRSAVLTGDTLFTDSVGRTELQFATADEGDGTTSPGAVTGAKRLYDSLHATLLAEPDDVVVCPGHFTVENDGTTGDVTPGDPVSTTVGNARTGIDLLSADRDRFVERITASLPEKPPNYESVIAANRGVEQPPDEVSAIELELGPNRCAAELSTEPTADD